jgi:cobalamin-dependent methionine synthase I
VNRSQTDIGPGADQGNRKKSRSALLGASPIGVELSDEDQLWPEQSTSATSLHHPPARYFNV